MYETVETLPTLPPRDPKGHKGTFGTVAIMGGCAVASQRMFGAPALAARAALRTGCGLAKLVVPSPVLDLAIQLTPSATGRGFEVDTQGRIVPHLAAQTFDEAAQDADAIAIGPGLGSNLNRGDDAGEGVPALVLRAIGQQDTPVVVDADALNCLAQIPDVAQDFRAGAILTPHPGEFKRLAKAFSISHDPTDPHARPDAAATLAQRLGCVVVLKGFETVVSDGLRAWTCSRGHPCLATAGTGDVLTGVIASLVAQFVAPGPRAIGGFQMPKPRDKPLDLFEAACLGVQTHAVAGETWAKTNNAEAGLLAEELADATPPVLESLRSST